MPVFCWTSLASNLLIIAAFPVLTATLALLMLDRYLGFHFFTNDGGGNSMLYMNLIWVWGHPEVYILVLPAFGIYLGGRLDLLGQAAVRLPLDGLRDARDLHPVLHGLAASLLHHGRGRRRQCHFRHCQHAHRDPDGREDLQLAVHDVRRPGPFQRADALCDRVHDHVRDRRPDRSPARHPAGRFRRFTTACSWSRISTT